MNTVIIAYNRVSIKCDLHKIKQKNTQYVLVVSERIAKTLSTEQLHFFDAVYRVNEVTEQQLFTVVQSYLTKEHRLQLVSDDENCLYFCAKIRETLQLAKPYTHDILPFVDKGVMKKALQGSGIRLPGYLLFDKIAYQKNPQAYLKTVLTQLKLPIFAKPVQEAGAIGVFEIHTEEELQRFACYSLESSLAYELDEYLQGTLFHIDSIVKQGKVVLERIFEYTTPVHNFSKGIPLGSIPWLKEHEDFNRLIQFNESVLNYLSPPDGATHLEVFKLASGELVFLEIAARAGGGYVIPNFEKTYGFNYEQAHFEAQLDLPIHADMHQPKLYHCWAYLPLESGTVMALHEPDIESDYTIQWHVKLGDHVQQSSNIVGAQNMAGIIFWWNKDYTTLYEDFQRIKKYKAIMVSSSSQ